jgi:flagellar protein FlgJ
MSEVSLKITNPEKHISSASSVKRNLSPEQKLKVANAAKDFESLMTGMMIKSMTQTTEGMFGDESFGGDVLDTVFETELAKQMTKGKGVGIARCFIRR